MLPSTPVKRFSRIHRQGTISLGDISDNRVRAQAARCLTGVLSPKFTQSANNLKDREHLVDLLFTTFDSGRGTVQSEVLHVLSESWVQLS
jgi:hypothetical protein